MDKRTQGLACIASTALICICTAAHPVPATTEAQVILRALAANPEIRATGLDGTRNSLDFNALQSHWLPSLELEAQERYLPYDSSAKEGARTRRYGTKGGATVTQLLPGGGALAAGLALDYDKDIRARSKEYTTGWRAEFNQPLLAGAWNHGLLQDTLRIRRIDQKQFTLEQRKRVLNAVSRIREAYWKAVEQAHLESIFTRELEYAEELSEKDRMRFRTGNASELDTLSSSLDRLKALERRLAAANNARLARLSLAVSLDLSSDSIGMDTAIGISLSAPPSAEQILSMAERLDPDLGIFRNIRERLEAEDSRLSNRMLPRLDLGFSHASSGISGTKFFDDRAPMEANTIVSLTLSYTIPMAEAYLERKKNALSGKSVALREEGYRNGLRERVEELRANWNQEIEQLEVAKAAKQVANKKLASTRAGFSSGTIDRLTLQKAENDYLVSAVTLVQRQIGIKRLEVVLDGIIGRFSGNMEIVWQ